MYTAALGWMPALPRILRVIASGRESDRGESPLDFLHGPTGCGGRRHGAFKSSPRSTGNSGALITSIPSLILLSSNGCRNPTFGERGGAEKLLKEKKTVWTKVNICV